ncbi:porin [Vicingus serpentipes]|uniref:Porin n=1 Tax=Vicingus serpentipes TaxID=1926625 RepID=A0A5C6RRC8_9FLAO|nr:porin [Vicingus serpentipes]TXB64747.1 porin [Vicingus serpentipes]
MNKIKLMLTSAFFTIAIYSFSQEVTNTKFGKGLYNVVAADSSWSMKFGARFQTLFIGEWNLNEDDGITEGTSKFLTRRARLKFDGFAYSPKLQYKLELGLSNRDISGASAYTSNSPRYILDAVLKWNFYKNLTLWVGQTKLPGNVERVISSANLQLVDRSLLNSRFNIDRDMGAQLRHHFKLGNVVIREIISASQGEGRNITSDNLGGYQWTSRLEILPFGSFKNKGDYSGGDLKREEKPKLALGGTFDYHDRAVKNRSNQGSYMTNDVGFYQTDVYTLFIDAMFKYKGFSLMAEYADRTAEDAIAKNSDGTETGDVVSVGNGLNAQVGYLFKNNWEVATRFTQIQLDKKITGKDVETQYTVGVSKYLSGHKLKIQSDVSYLTVENSKDSGLMYRLQIDVHF